MRPASMGADGSWITEFPYTVVLGFNVICRYDIWYLTAAVASCLWQELWITSQRRGNCSLSKGKELSLLEKSSISISHNWNFNWCFSKVSYTTSYMRSCSSPRKGHSSPPLSAHLLWPRSPISATAELFSVLWFIGLYSHTCISDFIGSRPSVVFLPILLPFDAKCWNGPEFTANGYVVYDVSWVNFELRNVC